MYLDTDIVLTSVGRNILDTPSLLIDEDKIKGSKTSTFTIFEIYNVMEDIKKEPDYKSLITEIKAEGIKLLSFTPEVMATALELDQKYRDVLVLQIEHFIHSAHSIHLEEPLMSPDPAYKKIEEIELVDLDISKEQKDYDFISENLSEDDLSIF